MTELTVDSAFVKTEMIEEEDIKTEIASVELSAEDNGVKLDPLGQLQCIKTEKISMESSAKVAENSSKASEKRRKYSAIGAAFHKVLAAIEMEEIDIPKVPPNPGSAPEKHLQYACKVCHKSFSVRASLLTHMRLHNMDNNLPSACQDCGVKCKHEKHFDNCGKLLKCRACEKPTDTRLGLRCSCAKPSYVCVHCMAGFKYGHELKTHLRAHRCMKKIVREKQTNKEVPRKWICESCDANFNTEAELQQHLRIHWGPEHGCSFCGLIFPLLTDLSKHLEQHVMFDDIFVCEICETTFTEYESLALHAETHKRTHTRTSRKYLLKRSCPIPIEREKAISAEEKKEMATDKSNVKPKQRSFHHTKPHKCGICQRRFATKYALKRHTFVDWICDLNNFRSKLFQCHRCQQGFRGVRAFRKHMKAHRKNAQEREEHANQPVLDEDIKLDNQKLLSSTSSNSMHDGSSVALSSHLESFKNAIKKAFEVTVLAEDSATHRQKDDGSKEQEVQKSDTAWYRCRLCYKAFHGILTLNNHRLRHGIRSYACEQCGAIFAVPCELSEHLATIHSKTPYQCRVCSKFFPTKSSLRWHGAGKTPSCCKARRGYKCLSCKKWFKRLYGLRDHQKFHLMDPQELPYSCSHCNAFFIYGNQRRMHLKQHPAETSRERDAHLSVKCKVCQKLFPNYSRMYAHKKLHRAKRSHDCEKCGAIFASPLDLKYHVTHHHSRMTYECPRCFIKFSVKEQLTRHLDRQQRCLKRAFLQKQYLCISCKKGFDSLRSFGKHYKLHCLDPKQLPFACSHCNAFFIYYRQLKTHHLKHSCVENGIVVAEPQTPAPRSAENCDDNVEHQFRVIIAEENQDSKSRSRSSKLSPISCSQDSIIAIDNIEWVVQVKSAEDGETYSPEKSCNMEIDLSAVKIERTTSYECLLNPEAVAIKLEQVEEDINEFHAEAVEIKTEKLGEKATNDIMNSLIKDEKF